MEEECVVIVLVLLLVAEFQLFDYEDEREDEEELRINPKKKVAFPRRTWQINRVIFDE